MALQIVDVLADLTNQTALFLPNIIGAVILLVIGLVLGKVIGRLMKELLIRVKLDYYVYEHDKPHVSFTHIFSLIVRWWIYLAFMTEAVRVLGLPTLVDWATRITNFIPNVIGADLIVVSGFIISEYIKGHLRKTREVYPMIVAKVLTFFILYVSVALALPVLGVSAVLVNNILLVIIASVGLGIAIALGLGTKDAVAELSKRYVRKLKV